MKAAKERKPGSATPIEAVAHSLVPCTGYDVAVGEDLLAGVPRDVVHLTNAVAYVVITDDNLKTWVTLPPALLLAGWCLATAEPASI